jgi:hypothetical protein
MKGSTFTYHIPNHGINNGNKTCYHCLNGNHKQCSDRDKCECYCIHPQNDHRDMDMLDSIEKWHSKLNKAQREVNYANNRIEHFTKKLNTFMENRK